MATYSFASLQFFNVLPFDPLADRIDFSGSGVSAADLNFDVSDGGGDDEISFYVAGKLVRLEMNPLNFSVDNIFTFDNSSIGLVGDNRVGIRDDDLANTLTGAGGNDILVGLGGNDVANGGGGNDIFYTYRGDGSTNSADNDTIDGGSGIDLLAATEGDWNNPTSVNINLVTGVANLGNQGTWTILNSSIENVLGHEGNDSLVGNDLDNVLDGGSGDGNDSLVGNGGNDFLFGRGGNDTLDGGAGNDFLRSHSGQDSVLGGAGNDTIRGFNTGDTVDGGADTDTLEVPFLSMSLTLVTNVENLTLLDGTSVITNGGIDQVLRGTATSASVFNYLRNFAIGDGNANRLTGSASDNQFDGGAGNDTIDGGAGWDTAGYESALSGVTATFNAQAGTGSVTGGNGTDTLLNIEGVRGSAFADSITGDAGNEGLAGREGNDTLVGDNGNDTLYGGSGNDSLDGGGGSGDWLGYWDAQQGVIANLATGSVANDGYGNQDTVSTVENLAGGAFNDSLTGSSGANTIYGALGDDTISGGAHNDSLDGGGGVDTVTYAGSGGGGISVNLATGAGSWIVPPGAGTDTLSNFENVIGDTGPDTLTGSSGDNVFEGGTGADSITGDAGFDTALYRAATASVTVNLSTGAVTSTDLGNDTLSGIEAVYTGSGNDTLTGRSLSAGEIEILGAGLGNDSITGGGGAGFTLVSFDAAASAVTASMSAGAVMMSNPGGLGTDTVNAVDGMVGSAFGDSLTGDTADNYFIGGAGNDSISGSTNGSGGDWVSYAGSVNPVIANLAVNTQIYAAPYGNLTLTGGAGLVADGVDKDTVTGGVQTGIDTLTGIENLIGGSGSDTLFGSISANVIQGGAGNDVIGGEQGNDSLDGGAGAFDQITYQSSTSGIIANFGATPLVVSGNTFYGNVTVAGGTALDGFDGDGGTALVQAGVDTLAGIEQIRGSFYGDSIRGSDTSVFYTGRMGDPSNTYFLSGNSTLGGATDTIDGGGGAAGDFDQVNYSGLATGIYADLRSGNVSVMTAPFSFGPQLAQLSNIDAVVGTANADWLNGGSDSRTFNGAKLEFYQGGGGNDTIQGSGGIDWVDIFNPTSNVNIDLSIQWGTQSQSGANDGFGGRDQYQNIDGIRVLGTTVTNDNLKGGNYSDGREYFLGGAGEDTINGRDDFDVAMYQNSPNAVYVNLARGVAYDGWGSNDHLSNIEGVSGGDFDDTLIGGAGGEEFYEEFEGRAGNDFLDGNDGFVPLHIGEPVIPYDAAAYHNAPGAVFVNIDDSVHDNGSVTLLGGQAADGYGGIDTLVGIEGVRGSKFNDTIYGGHSDHDLFEFFEGRQGNDFIDGGSGNDWIMFESSESGVSVNLGANTVLNDGWGGMDTLVSIEHVFGSDYNDLIVGSAADNVLSGSEGNDTLRGGAGNDQLIGSEHGTREWEIPQSDWADFSDAASAVTASLATGIASSADTGLDTMVYIQNLRGGSGADTLTGDESDNRLLGGAGSDRLIGGAGNDLASYADATGNLTITVGTGTWTATDGFGNTDTLVSVEGVSGGSGNDTLTGNAFDNAFSGGAGNDSISGLGGFDRLSYESSTGPVIINLGAGQQITTLSGAYGSVTIQGGSALDGFDKDTVIDGLQAYTDTLSGIEAVKGSAFDDVYFGQDSLTTSREFYNPGGGNDTVIGGTALTVLVFRDYEAGIFVNLATTPTLPGGNSYFDIYDGDGFNSRITYLSVEGIVGGIYNDSLVGLSNANTYFDGGAGSDTLDPGGGTGFDIVSYRNAINPIIANLGGGTITRSYFLADGTSEGTQTVGARMVLDGYGGDGSQLYFDALNNTGNHFEQLEGSNYNDYIFGGPVANRLYGFDGDDTLGGSSDQSTAGVLSTEFANTLDGSNDTLDGGAGNDVLFFTGNTQNFTGGGATVNFQTGFAQSFDGVDKLIGIERVTATAGNDSLTGRNDHVIQGMFTRDVFEGFQPLRGNDTIDGGGTGWGQFDILDLSGFSSGVNLPTTGAVANLGANTVTNDGSGTVDTIVANTIDMLIGNQFNDSLTGGSTSRTYTGGLFESFRGNAGNDTINGMGGEDRLDYLNSTGPVVVNLGGTSYSLAGTMYASLGTLAGSRALDGFDSDTVTGGIQSTTDTLVNIERARGSVYSDTLIGGGTHNAGASSVDRFYDFEGFEGLDGNDFIDGGAGNDLAIYQRSPSAAIVNLDTSPITVGTYTVAGGSAHDGHGTVDTLLNIEVVIGSDFDDYVQGSANNEQLNGGAGDDTLHGGGGNDRLSYISSPNGVYVNLATGTATDGFDRDTLTGGLQAYTDTFDGFEAVRGSQQGDTLLGSAGDDTLDGLGGGDSIDGGDGIDTASYANDEQYGSVRGVIVNLGATDFISGATTVQGGHALDGFNTSNSGPAPGDDTLTSIEVVIGTAFADTLIGGAGDESLSGASPTETIDTGDSIAGGGGNDTLDGYAGNDTLDGGAGIDSMSGGAGNDTYFVGDNADVVVETDAVPATGGIDLVISVAPSYTLAANVGDLQLDGGANIDGTGNADLNLMIGNTGNNVLSGLGGLDLMFGGLGNDSLFGGTEGDQLGGDAGDDSLDGGTGNDTLIGGDGNDTFIVDAAGDVVTESNTLIGVGGDDIVQSNAGSYTLSANVERLTLETGALNGTGNALNNTMVGNALDNSISGAAGSDYMTGGLGNDTYVVDAAGDVIAELDGEGTADTAQIDTATYTVSDFIENITVTLASGSNVTANAAGNLITGAGGNDTLAGAAGNDTINSGLGNDSLDGGTGNDSMSGGQGNDSYVVDASGDAVVEVASQGDDHVFSSMDYTLTANVERLTLLTGALNGAGNTEHNTITGNADDNSLAGDIGNDSLIGGDGNDTLDGGLGNDSMSGGEGDDQYIVGAAGDIVTESNTLIGVGGDDIVHSSVSSYTLTANVERLTLESGALNGTGNALDNTIVGDAADNSISGAAGNDTMSGGLGNDTYVVDAAGDIIVEQNNQGTDTVQTDAATYTIAEYLENVTVTRALGAEVNGNELDNLIIGGAGNDTLWGGDGNDTIAGGAGNDTLWGGDGNDTIAGGLGNDFLDGEVDQDTLDYRTATLAIAVNLMTNSALGGGQGTDVVANFEAVIGTGFADTLTGGAGHTLTGGLGNDNYTVSASSTTVVELTGGGANDIVTAFQTDYTLSADVETLILTGAVGYAGTGNTSNNSIVGSAGGDLLTGGAGNDTMSGGLGNDTYRVDSAADVIIETSLAGAGSADLVQVSGASFSALTNAANVENFTVTDGGGRSVTGNALANSMTGGAGNDTLVGDAGNDTLRGGAGLDALRGGAGNDRYIIDDTINGAQEIAGLSNVILPTILELAGAGTDTVVTSVSFLRALAPNIENIEQAMGAGAAIVATGNDLNNHILGNEFENKLHGGIGNDTLQGGAGNDTLYGGAGADRYIIDAGNDVIVEAGGSTDDGAVQQTASFDQNQSAQGVDNFFLEGAATDFQGNDNATRITAGDGSQTVRTGGGNDTVNTGGGDDVIEIENPGASIDGGAGNDRIELAFNYTLHVSLEDLTFLEPASGPGNFIGTGNASKNVMNGNSGDNRLVGLAGADTLNGNTGNDTLEGGLGNDSLDGGADSDWVSYAAETTAVTVNLGAGTGGSTAAPSATNAGVDVLFTIENAAGGKGNDALTGDTLGGNALFGDAGNDTLTGLTGDDSLDGGLGNDSMVGGDGNDTYVVDLATEAVVEDSAGGAGSADLVRASVNYTLGANVENLLLLGTTGLSGTGNALNNDITGNSGANLINGGAGNDTMTGGLGNDSYTVDDVTDDVIEALNGGIDTVTSTTLGSFTLAEHIENLTLSLGTGVTAIGNAVNNSITGGAGSDILNGMAGNDTLNGGAGNDLYHVDSQGDVIVDSAGTQDVLIASVSYSFANNAAVEGAQAADNDEDISITGNAGNNAIYGNEGNNLLVGGAGNDAISGSADFLGTGNDTLDGGLGVDQLDGGIGNDTYILTAGDIIAADLGGNDTIVVPFSVNLTARPDLDNVVLTGAALFAVGNAEDNQLTGTAANNTLNGVAGNDTMTGLAGNDIYGVDNLDDVVIESTAAAGGIDTIVLTNAMTYSLFAGIENLVFDASVEAGGTLHGTDANNGLSGAGGNDTLFGGAGNDTMFGQGGNDSLDGGLGNDSMIGGAGNDTFVVNAAGDAVVETTLAGGGNDTVQTSFANAAGNTYSIFIPALAAIENVVLGGSVANAIGNAGHNSLTGNGGNNSLSGGAGNDTLDGGVGDDTLEGGAGSDSMTGGEGGSDWVSYFNETAAVTAMAGISTVANTGAALGDTLVGIENLLGGKGNDMLSGDTEANILDGSLGADTLIGGGGNDTFVVDNVLDNVRAALDGGIQTVRSSVNFNLTAIGLVEGVIENLVLLGTAATGTGNDEANRIEGNASNNTLTGSAGNDTLIGGAGNDSMVGGLNDDTVDYSLTTSAITLTLSVSPGNIIVTGGAGTDTLTEIEKVIGGAGSDWAVFTGGTGVNVDVFGEGTPYDFESIENLRGTVGDDTLTGCDDDNILQGGLGNDVLDGEANSDWASYAEATQTVTVILNGLSNGSAEGGAGNDVLIAIENVLGGSGNDNLTGDEFDNILDGGLGNDVLTGGDGSDIYIVNALLDRVHEAGIGDTDAVHSLQSIDLSAATGIVATSNLAIENVTLLGTAAINATGNALDNVLTGNTAANVLIGGTGNDTLIGGAGADSLRGGAGNDEYTVDNAGDKVDEAFAGSDGIDSVFSTVTFALSGTAASVEELFLQGAANIHGTGNALENYIEGNSGSNSLVGGGANDSLFGGSGNDTLDGGLGNDTLTGGNGNDLFLVDSVDDMVNELSDGGIDVVAALLTVGDVLTMSTNVENATLLGTGNKHVTGNSGDNFIIGNAGHNSLDGGSGDDTLRGGAGNDSYSLNSEDDVVDEVTAGGGIDTVMVTNFDYSLGVNVENLIFTGEDGYSGIGNALNNALTGGAGNDQLLGEAGNDTLNGGTGNDTMAGGLGNDTHQIDNLGDIVVELAAGGTDTLASETINLDLNDPAYANFENLLLLGGFAGSATGNAAANLITGSTGNNTLTGNAGNDSLVGGAGNDTLDGGVGVDSMNGGAGDDRYLVDVAGDVIVVDTLGNDTVVAGAGNSGATIYTIATRADLENVELAGGVLNAIGNANANILTGNGLNNSLSGAAGIDTLDGGDGNDILDGGVGADSMTGSEGNDLYFVDSAGDTVLELDGEGFDTVNTTLNGYVLEDYFDALILTGPLALSATGNELANKITAGAGSGTLNGAEGNDTLDGGLGNDTLIGDIGDDVFIFDQADLSVQGGTGTDTLKVAGLLGTAAAPFDFGLLIDERLDSIEVIDITGTGNNSIKVNLDDVVNITDLALNPELQIDGNAGDFVKSDDTWEVLGYRAIGDVYYVEYRGDYLGDSVTLLVNQAVTQSFITV